MLKTSSVQPALSLWVKSGPALGAQSFGLCTSRCNNRAELLLISHVCVPTCTSWRPLQCHAHPLRQMCWLCAGLAVSTSGCAVLWVRVASLGHASGDKGSLLQGGVDTQTCGSASPLKLQRDDREEKALTRGSAFPLTVPSRGQ